MALSPAMQKLVSQAKNKYSRGGGNRIKPKEGVNRYRILVPNPDEKFWADLGVHWIKDDPNGKPLAVVGCEDIVHDAPCPICTAIDLAISSAIDEDSKKLYAEWKAKKTVLLNVLDRSKGSQNPDDVQILELTTGTFGDIMGIMQQYADEGEDLFDPNTGVDIAIEKSGKGLNTKYAVNVAAGKNHAPVTDAQLKACHDLSAHIEKEFFRGDEQKALNQIAQIAHITVPRLGAAAGAAQRTPTAALTSRAAKVEDAAPDLTADLEDDGQAPFETEEEEKTPAPAKTAAPAKAAVKEEVVAAVDDADVDDILADLDTI